MNVGRAVVAGALSVVATFGGLAVAASNADAASSTRYVATSGADANNDCATSANPCRTIQHAVDVATDGTTVDVGAGTYAESVSDGFDGGGAADLTIVGAGSSRTKVTGGSGGGANGAHFGFGIQGHSVTLRDLAVTGVKGKDADEPGIGVFAVQAELTLVDSSVSGNHDAGVVGEAARIATRGSRFDDNGSKADVGSLGFVGCGVLNLDGSTSVTTTSASGNALCGVAVLAGFVDGQEIPEHGLTFTRSTAANNTGPGLLIQGDRSGVVDDSTVSGNGGGGVYVGNSTVAISNSTVTGTKKYAVEDVVNEAAVAVDDLPGGGDDSATDSQGRSTLNAPAQISRTARRLGRQLDGPAGRSLRAVRPAAAAPAPSEITLAGTIVADNSLPDCSRHFTDAGYNISDDTANSCGFSAGAHSQSKTAPKLGSLADHGGATQTRLPLKGSPAIDAQPAGAPGCTSGATDQRGVARPQPSGGRCDIGSVELAGAKLAITTTSLPHGTVGEAYRASVHATGGQYPTYAWSLADGSVPPGVSFHDDGTFSGTPTKAGRYSVTVSVNDPVTRRFTIVVDPAVAPAGNGAAPIAAGGGGGNGANPVADTGTDSGALTAWGGSAVLAGMLVLLAAGLVGRRPGRHRSVSR